MNITDIDIYETNKCENGYIEIRDGYWFKSPLIGKYCGSGKIPTSIISQGHRMLITYMVTPNQHNHRGFNATYEGLFVFFNLFIFIESCFFLLFCIHTHTQKQTLC